MITYNHKLNMTPGGIPTRCKLGQYDDDWSIVFSLYSAAGDFTLESGTYAMIRGTKRDGLGYSANCTVNISNKTVTVTGHKQITAVAGENIFEIVLYKGTKELSSTNVIFYVERAAMDAGTLVSDSQVQEILDMSEDVIAASENVETVRGNFAPAYSTSATYAVGDYVMYSNQMYRCTTAISTAEAWTAAHWTAVKIGSEIGNLKSALSDNDLVLNDIHSLVNYGYSDYYRKEITGDSWFSGIAIERRNQVVKINRPTIYSGQIYINLTGEVNLYSSNSDVRNLSGGINLVPGNKYRATLHLISGTSIYDENTGALTPRIAVIKQGNNSAAGTIVKHTAIDCINEFTAEDNALYRVFLYLNNNKYTINNAVMVIILEDLTISRVENLKETTEDITYKAQLNTDIINDEHGLIDYDYGKMMNIPLGDSSTWKKALGVYRKGMKVTLNKDSQVTSAIYVRLDGDDCGLYASSQIHDLTGGITLTTGERYILKSVFVRGTSTFGETENYAPPVAILDITNQSTIGTGIRIGNGTYKCSFSAPYGPIAVLLYIAPSSTASTIFTDAEIVLTLTADDSQNGGKYPTYYDNYLPNRIADIKNIGLNVGINGQRFFFITDYHAQNNTKISGALMYEIAKQTGIRNVYFGGDAEQSETTKAAGYSAIVSMVENFAAVSSIANMYYITGNHEMNNPTGNPDYSDRQIDESVIGRLFFDQMHDIVWLQDVCNSFYRDDDNAKIRTYFIGCDSKALITVSTRDAIANSLFTVPSGYAVLVISHVGLTTTWDNDQHTAWHEEIDWRLKNIVDVCTAMNDGTTCTVYLGPNSTLQRTYDFTGNQRTFIGVIAGHSHRDGCVVHDSRFPVITTATDAYAVASVLSPPLHGQTPGTIYEQCFDVVQIDNDNKYIYMTRIGDGEDRTFKFGSGAGLLT